MQPNKPQTVYEMLVELAQTLNDMQVESASRESDDSYLEARREGLKRIGRKILQENNGHIDMQVNMQGDTGGALVLLVSVDALYVPYNLG
ncbi:hypothetical protein FBR02_04500 [Anaerolineae bacterium CFX9]|jgi:hypothetical protein|nr:hypothetical protein [Anaerolineae bacterium CFX9]